MRKLGFIGLYLQPSVASIFFVIIATLVIFGSTLVSFGGANDSFYRLVLGEESTVDFVDSTKSTYTALNDKVFNNPVVNKIVFFSFWFFTGLIAFLLFSSITSSIGAAKQLTDQDQLYNAPRNMLQNQLRTKFAVRAAALFGWVIYTVLFSKLILPYAVLSFKIATDGAADITNVGTGLLGGVILLVAWHIHVVFLRAFLIKPRAFGGSDDLLAARLT